MWAITFLWLSREFFAEFSMIIAPGKDKERILKDRAELPRLFPYQRAMNFSRIPSGLEVPSWYAEGKDFRDAMKDPTSQLVFRNAAIVFNNLGVVTLDN